MNSVNSIQLCPVITSATSSIQEDKAVLGYRFDIFKGIPDSDGKIVKVKSLGSAYVKSGQQTYSINLKTFLTDQFYLLPNTKPDSKSDYVILTRENAKNIARKY